MKLIPLTQGLFARVDDTEYDWLMQWKWTASKNRNSFYAQRETPTEEGSKTISMHRQIMGFPARKVDHRDHDGLNNQRHNLREATTSQNGANSKIYSTNTSGFRGVSYYKRDKKWSSQIRVAGQTIRLGTFPTREEAAIAYAKVHGQYFGDFAAPSIRALIEAPKEGKRAEI